MKNPRHSIVAIAAIAWIAIASAALAVSFDGHVYQVVQECEVVQTETAWAGEANYWAPGTPKTNAWGSGFTLPLDFESPYITGFYAGQHHIAGQVIVTRLPDAHGVEVTILTQNGWVLDKTHVYAGHTPPPTNPGGKLVPGHFPEGEDFLCADQVTYATYVFEKDENAQQTVVKGPAGKPQQAKGANKGPAAPQNAPETVLYVAVHAEVCRCEPVEETLDVIPLAGAVVEFRSLNKNGVERVALAITDADGYYHYDTGVGQWDVAGYFTDTTIRLVTPVGLVIPDIDNVELEPHPSYQGDLADLYADFYPIVVGQEVLSPNEGAVNGEVSAAKSILNVDFYVLPF